MALEIEVPDRVSNRSTIVLVFCSIAGTAMAGISSFMASRGLGFVIALLFSFLTAHATEFVAPDKVYLHRVWQTDDGMPNNSVRAVIQSRDGFLWIATDAGLARFDGTQFTEIEKLKGDKRSRWICGLCESADGSIWSTSVNGGVVQYKNGKLKRFTARDGLPHDMVLTVMEDKKGSVWIGTAGGLCRYSDGKFISYTNTPGLIVEAVRDLLEDSKGNLWIGTAKGLSCLRPDGSCVSYVTDYTTADSLVNDAVLALAEDAVGGIWVGTSGGINYLRDGQVRNFTVEDGLLHNVVRSFLQDSEGRLWIGTQGGLQQYLDGQFRNVVLNNPADSDLEGISYVYSMYEDRSGNIWVGNSVGLNRLCAQSFMAITQENGLPSNEATCVLEDRTGTIWIGTFGAGICRIDGNRLDTLTRLNGLKNNHVLALYEDKQGAFWIGFDGSGVQRFGDTYFTDYEFKDPKANVVRTIYGERNGDIWMGHNAGTAEWKRGKFEPDKGISRNTIKAITQDKDGHMWMAGETALHRYAPAPVGHTFNRKDGYGEVSANALYVDAQNICWVGTDAGLYYVRSNTVVDFTKSSILAGTPILEIVEDGFGRFWMSSRNGVLVVSRADLVAFGEGKVPDIHLLQLGKSDGLKRAQTNGNGKPGAWKTRDGRILFATLNGIIVFDAKKIKIPDTTPVVRLEEISLDGRLYPLKDGLEFGPARGNVQLRYATIDLQDPEKVAFKYRLEGFDEGWVDAGSRRTASYQLRSGTYTFKVIACNRSGYWTPSPSALTFTLRPPFYETPLFYGTAVIGLIGGGAAFSYLRRLEVKRRERELMELVEVHTAKYRQTAQSMESFNYSIAHDLRAPLRAIKGLTEALQEDLAYALDPTTRDYMRRITASVDRMDSLITGLLSYGRISHKDYKFSTIDLDSVLSQALCNLEREVMLCGAKLDVKRPLGMVSADEALLNQVFSNLLSNSLKFVSPGATPLVRIWSEVAGDRLKVFIKDNGIGIEPRFHTKIFGLFERLQNSEQYPGTGIGLAIVQKAVEQMNGRIDLTSEVGAGTCFCIELSKAGNAL